ncbi:MAG TPA: B12-binding domain-containing radical SAM protein, partial [Thermoanaerobaculia bacterium]|nr:B12-binding domain-containing radical SAM protein [Thermoanaerobaculia bacterium]
MADLLLTHGYFLYQDAKEVEIMKPYPPLGLLYLSAWLKREGFDVEVWDSTFAEPAALAARFAASPRGVVGIY